MKIFGIDPGSERTGYGCIEVIGSRHHLVICGSIAAPARSTFPDNPPSRCLLYVALSRAKSRLMVVVSRQKSSPLLRV